MRPTFHIHKVQRALKLMDRKSALGSEMDATPFRCVVLVERHDQRKAPTGGPVIPPLASSGSQDIKVGA